MLDAYLDKHQNIFGHQIGSTSTSAIPANAATIVSTYKFKVTMRKVNVKLNLLIQLQQCMHLMIISASFRYKVRVYIHTNRILILELSQYGRLSLCYRTALHSGPCLTVTT